MTDTRNFKAVLASKLKFLGGAEHFVTGIASTSRLDAHGHVLHPEGARWDALPIELLREHDPNQPLGHIVELKATKAGLKFKARIDSADAWADMRAGGLRGVSVSSKPIDFDRIDGKMIWNEWTIAEISLCEAPANGDAMVEGWEIVDTAKHAPIEHHQSVVVDTKATQLRDISTRLRDLAKARQKYANRYRQVIGAERDAMAAALKTVDAETQRLIEKQVQLETGIEPEAKQATAPAQPPRSWEVKGLAEPEYPWGARKAGDKARIDKAFEAHLEYYQDHLAKVFQEIGQVPDDAATIEDTVFIHAVQKAGFIWTSRRVQELEERVAELEANQQKFAGVHQRSLPYRKGNLVVHASSLWVALADIPEGAMPGTSDLWQMAVKAGSVG
ncbi:hypothetical protein CK218_22245 [Mesorhizobium sp. WSM3879]|uniref:HK97 family phage prohead protease n=1 Tax=Mesorhizobium sp. WSM3879 TaxID=2029406 RepID=UPI000BB0BD35|nr:HK97 family phage prohead protease [Mesorhizobium sp. WSM3879]PBB79073.1 hypothetical protein CK218_22245 [Mesorhizobium sp. WSM3879]